MTDQERCFELVRRLAQLGMFSTGKAEHGSHVIVIPEQSFDKLDALITHAERKSAPTPTRFRDDYDPEPDYLIPTRFDIGPDGQV